VSRREDPYRIAWVLAALGVVVVLVLSLLVLVGVRWWGGSGECRVTVGERTVELDSDDAEAASTVAARAVRRRLSAARAERAVAKVLDASDDDARVVTAALTGRAPRALSCRHGGAEDTESDRLDRVGLTHRAAVARWDVQRAFGPQKLGGYAPGGVRSGHMVGSAHYEGRAIDVFFRPITRQNRVRGWAMAQYLVAHAERLELNTVIYDGRIWTARRSFQGWRTYRVSRSGRSAATVAILEHRDHVHLDVAD
jgi:hypothetical protein